MRQGGKFAAALRPLLLFSKGETFHTYRTPRDLVFSRDKIERHHPLNWQQPADEATYFISHLTHPNASIIDPFLGSGTTAVAVVRAGQARVIIDGRHVYLGPFGSSATTKAERGRIELERSVGPVADVTVIEGLIRYHAQVDADYRKHGRPTSQVLLVRLALRVVREKFGDLEAKRFDPKAIQACQDEFVAQGLLRDRWGRGPRRLRQDLVNSGLDDSCMVGFDRRQAAPIPRIARGHRLRRETPDRAASTASAPRTKSREDGSGVAYPTTPIEKSARPLLFVA